LFEDVPLDPIDVAQKWDRDFTAAAIANQISKGRPARRALSNFCSCCGEEIPEARRLAMPTARTCVDCQTDIEKGRP
jgi:phage/conjugal plasmid C-4 type zinc finger TraR family protein